MPSFWVFNPAYAQVQNEHVWSIAWTDIMTEGMTPQAAAERRSSGSRRSSRNIRSRRAEGQLPWPAHRLSTRSAARRSSGGRCWRYWQGGLQGSEFTWAVAFIVPYIGVFLAFVVYPVLYGAWLGSEPQLYRRAVLRPDLPAHRGEHPAVSRHRREPEDVRRAAAVGLLHAARLVGQGAAADLRAALGDAGAAQPSSRSTGC